MNINIPVADAGMIFKRYRSQLKKLGINILGDLLYHLPFRYDDLRIISKIGDLQTGETVTIQGEVIFIDNIFTKRWKKIQKAKIADNTGQIEVAWFNQPFLSKVIHIGDKISIAGKVDYFSGSLTMQSPEYEIIVGGELLHTARLVPVYPETKGISSKWLRRQIYKTLQDNKQNILEFIPESIIKNNHLLPLLEALEKIHFPHLMKDVVDAKKRLAFDELLLIQLAAMKKRKEWECNLNSPIFKIKPFIDKINMLIESLPFTLTKSQKEALEDIFNDMSTSTPMNRLLEGDVGSGKTIVAAIAMYIAKLNGYQSTLMAPTEILAQQHYDMISKLLCNFDVGVELITGNKKINKNKNENKIDILIGTHALLFQNTYIHNIGFVIIDEQQRFGVTQRSTIRKKGVNPHLLSMTATPIPRTIALTLYGDLDLSILNEMPIGRKKIKTWLVPSEKRNKCYSWIEKEIIENNSQTFIICPFIDESESMQTIKAASKEFDRLKKDIFPNLKIGLLHGKMKSKEKDNILNAFRKKEFDILVATPVVEVGIDISNATIMVIEASERFGLSQLHQLRGRVGRGNKQSYCILFTESTSTSTSTRLKAMENMDQGRDLAELDLRMRGSGELFGTMQHGTRQFKIADFSDNSLIQKTKNEAKIIFNNFKQYPYILEKVNRLIINEVSPD